MADTWTNDPRTVATYDVECRGRRDEGFYLDLADELGARACVDLGCGTGTLAIALARPGRTVIGVDPALPMLEAARRQPDGGLVRWRHGTAADLPDDVADLAIMTGHVAQYFVDDGEWLDTLGQVRRALHEGGVLAFESRVPDRGWRDRWTRELTRRTLPHPDGGTFTSWGEVIDVVGPPTSFTQTHVGHVVLPDGTHVEHPETLRFRSEEEIRTSLAEAGFVIEAIWGDWDRSALTSDSDEIIVLARRP